MGDERPSIRVKAMLIAPNDDGSAHLVSVHPPNAGNPHGYYRLIGGSVEFGETHLEAIVREVEEETGATVRDLRLLDAVESIFRYPGADGHEIVFLYTGRLDPAPATSGAVLTESDGTVVPLVWRPCQGHDVVPLYPVAARDWFERLTGG